MEGEREMSVKPEMREVLTTTVIVSSAEHLPTFIFKFSYVECFVTTDNLRNFRCVLRDPRDIWRGKLATLLSVTMSLSRRHCFRR